MPLSTTTATNHWEFHPAGFALALGRARRAAGLSTRELARRAGISQSYVVTLERSRHTTARRTPVPTVDVVARVAEALGLEPQVLYSASLRRAGQHVLLVTDAGAPSPLSIAKRIATRGDQLDWVVAASGAHGNGRLGRMSNIHQVDLRRDGSPTYRPGAIAAALHDELAALHESIEGRQLGLVFAETSSVMSALDEPTTVIDFEEQWDSVVRSACTATGAHAAWNVCVYELAALRRLTDPVAATLQLVRTHDTVWSARRSEVVSGRDAARQILDHFRPHTDSRSAWRTHIDQWITELGLVA